MVLFVPDSMGSEAAFADFCCIVLSGSGLLRIESVTVGVELICYLAPEVELVGMSPMLVVWMLVVLSNRRTFGMQLACLCSSAFSGGGSIL